MQDNGLQANRLQISALLDLYGAVLSDRQRDVLQLYYNDDLSLAEIAEDTGITRQGVRDAIKKAEKELAQWEARLGFLAKTAALRSTAEDIASVAAASGNDVLAQLARKLLSEI